MRLFFNDRYKFFSFNILLNLIIPQKDLPIPYYL